MKRIFVVSAILCLQWTSIQAQQIIDEIIAVIGDEILLYSDLEAQKGQFIAQGFEESEELDCQVLESMLFEKLLVHRSKVDSIEVSDSQIESELDRRINMFASQVNGIEELEKFYGKSIAQIRKEFRVVLEDQLRAQSMQQQIVSAVRVTPDDVEEYFKTLPEDSIPLISAQVEVAQIVKKPKPSKKAIEKVKKDLLLIREGVITGDKDFATEAVLGSKDEGSAVKGGELGCVGRGVMVPEFEQQAYNLDEGEISKPFKTDFGYHILQLIRRNGDEYCSRHILFSADITTSDRERAKTDLDSVLNLIRNDTLTFAQAAVKISEDEGTRFNGGRIINPNTGSVKFDMDQIDPQLFLVIDKLGIGQISEPVVMRNQRGENAYRIVKLINRSEAHKANLIEDYQLFQDMTRASLSEEVVMKWTESNIDRTYIRVDEERASCPSRYNWFKDQ